MLFKKSHNKPLINLDRLVIMGKYQTLVFYVQTECPTGSICTAKPSAWYFPVTTAVWVNNKLIVFTYHKDVNNSTQYCYSFLEIRHFQDAFHKPISNSVRMSDEF